MIWSLDISTDYEAAREAINHLVATRVAEREREWAKAVPNGQRLQQMEADIVRLGSERRFLTPGTPEVARVRRAYGALIREARESREGS